MENRIKQLRQRLGITQEEFAERLGVSRQTVVSLEKGKYNPSVVLGFRIARVFNTTIEDIFIMEEEDYYE